MSASTELPGATLRTASVSDQDNMAYLLTCAETGAQLLIDAADRPADLLSMVRAGADGQTRLDHLLTTHQHWDHHRALADVAAVTGATTSAGVLDAADLPITVDRTLSHGDRLEVGAMVFDVIHLRGHTPGSVALAFTDAQGGVHLFTGDSLFPGGVGNTWNDPDRFASLIDDVERRLFERFPDEAKVYPGHGAGTTLGVERPHLGEWRERGW